MINRKVSLLNRQNYLQNKNSKKGRESGIELLKIIAIIMIIFSHAMPTTMVGLEELPDYIMQLEMATNSFQRLIIVLFKYSGQLGNAVFIICSAWFLLESKSVNLKKVFYMIADSWIISVAGLGIFMIVGYEIPVKIIIKQFMPITVNANWFIGCYLLFYLIHPAMNRIIEGLDQRTLLSVNLVIMGLYNGIQFLLPNKFYYNQLIGFICIYFIIAYVKKYLKNTLCSIKVNVIILIVSTVGLLTLIGLTNYLGLRIDFFADKLTRWSQFMNPFIIMCALSLFQLMRRKVFVSRKVNYIASMSMLFFIIHYNYLVVEYLRTDFFKYVYEIHSYQYELVWVVIYALVSLFGATILSIVYKQTLQKVVKKLCDWLYKEIEVIYSWCVERILKLN